MMSKWDELQAILATERISREGMAAIASQVGLDQLEFRPGTAFDDGVFSELGEHGRLKRITITDSSVDGDDLSAVLAIPKLQMLSMRGGEIDEGAVRNQDATALVQLRLEEVSASEKMLLRLMEIAGLETVWFNGMTVGAPLVRALSHLHNLRWLMLMGTDIGDEDVLELSGLLKLSSLAVRDTRVTSEGLLEFFLVQQSRLAEGTRRSPVLTVEDSEAFGAAERVWGEFMRRGEELNSRATEILDMDDAGFGSPRMLELGSLKQTIYD